MSLRSGHVSLNISGYLRRKVATTTCPDCDRPGDVYRVLLEFVSKDSVWRQTLFSDRLAAATVPWDILFLAQWEGLRLNLGGPGWNPSTHLQLF
ncbi:jg8027 [Pararge aegeria aegeria]|uniref:Jg8027 protein n=1 Tax=Pararge aegeria aegeria TaxID=348720 RepID=A0A8S4RGQ6_9NEOP|nr:jg8027 [Pararge aegeria aegeria]